MTQEQPRELSVLESLRARNPERSLPSLAVEYLHTQDEMAAFLREYTQHLRTTSDNPMARRDPLKAATGDILQAAWNYPYNVVRKWDGLMRTGTIPPRDVLNTSARKKPGQNGGF